MISSPILLWWFSLLPISSCAFAWVASPSALRDGFLLNRHMTATSTEDIIAEAESDRPRLQGRTPDNERNIFYDYDKPLVLLGCSGGGGELKRLAEFLLTEHFGSDSTNHLKEIGDTDSSTSSSAGLIELAKVESANELSLRDMEKLLTEISRKEYRWPDIIVVDFGDPLFVEAEGTHASDLESYYGELAKALYEKSGLLSIYINVDPDGSNMSIEAKDRKSRMEDMIFVPYSDYEVCIRDEGISGNDDAWSHIEWELARIVARARLIAAIPGDTTRSTNSAHLTMGQNTFFLSLSFPEISEVEPYVEEMCRDVDAMEYRADLLKCRENRFDMLYGLQKLRRYCRPHTVRVPALPFGSSVIEDVMPIVYTVRTEHQAGTWPDDKDGIAKMFELLEWGLRAGVEVLDVESAWDKAQTDKLLTLAERRHTSQILGSHHMVGEEVTTEDAVKFFQQCALKGRAHGAKVVLTVNSEDKDRMAYEAAAISASLAASQNEAVIPSISLVLGDIGKYSRILNTGFTPVTHESLPFVAAPGQLTANEIMTTRLLTKIIEPKSYAILGHNIAYSVSPQMQGAAFAAARLPHKFLRADVPTVEEFVESDFFKSDDFGGCAVTIPHKQAIMEHVDVMSDAAREIGSVNTLIAKTEIEEDSFKRVIYGDNTDWKGIFNPLNRMLGGQVNSDTDFALILGAGGTARAASYVAAKLGLKRLYYNRTPSKAADLIESFGGTLLSSLDDSVSEDGFSLGSALAGIPNSRLRVVISTLPHAAGFVLPEWLIDDSFSTERPIVFDVNYKPYNTKLLLQAEEAGCNVVRGSEMLWEQGIGQFEMWTGRTAPYSVMKNVVLVNCMPATEGK